MNTVSIAAPASKSLSHRVLMAAGLARGHSSLSHVLESQDTERTRDILTSLGARFERTAPGAFQVQGIDGRITSDRAEPGTPLPCYVGESGTTCRLITAILAAGAGTFRIYGAGRMHDRPLGDLPRVLASLGASLTFEEKPGCPPLVLRADGLHPERVAGGEVEIGCDDSSQYLSGLLLAAPLGSGLVVRLGGGKVVSWPYVSLTLDTLERFGIAVRVEQRGPDDAWETCDWRTLAEAAPGRVRFRVSPGVYQAGTYTVEGDWSGASYFLAAGAIGPRAVRVTGLQPDSLQGDAALLGILEKMGARVAWDEEGVCVSPAPLRGVELDMGHSPDLVPTVAALAAHASGRTVIRNVAHLKIKESDRLEAPARELAKVGCDVTVTEDGLSVLPPAGGIRQPAPDVVFSAHNDHRMAMSVSLLGLAGTGGGRGFPVPVDEPSCVAKSFPDFWQLWEKVRA